MYYHHNGGWIEVICGSMFSGKTEELIRRLRRAVYAKQTVQVFKPTIDDRFSTRHVSSHAGASFDAQIVNAVDDIAQAIKPETTVIGIDEVQFFDWEVTELCEALANQGKRVIIAGLDMDFRGEPFGPMPILIAQAEQVDKLQAICMVCGASASRTQRLVDGRPVSYDAPLIVVGAEEVYEARCRKCHEVPSPINQT